MEIVRIELADGQDRKILVELDNGAIITIKSCYESWQQYGGTENDLWMTIPVANAFNDWLHFLTDDIPVEYAEWVDIDY